jgi:hypothetical protein
MRYLEEKSCRIALALIGVYLLALTGDATVSMSGDFHNSDYELSLSESMDNANFAGSIELLPYSGFDDLPYSIFATGSGDPNGRQATTEHSSQLAASGNGKTVVADSMLQEDPNIKAVLDINWGHQVIMGDLNQENSLYQFTNLKSHPGYLTFPTSSTLDSVTTGMTLQAVDDSGQPLFDKIYVPGPEFGEPRITLSVMKSEYKNVFMETKLKVGAKW